MAPKGRAVAPKGRGWRRFVAVVAYTSATTATNRNNHHKPAPSLSPRTALEPFVHARRYSTIPPAHTLAASLASQKFRRKPATGCAATLLCEQQHQPGVFRRSAPPGIRSFGVVSIMQPTVDLLLIHVVLLLEYSSTARTQVLVLLVVPVQK
eukprot:COSAG02_NODE_1848_length_10680_cov_53.675551_4_plen_152_part_00